MFPLEASPYCYSTPSDPSAWSAWGALETLGWGQRRNFNMKCFVH